ncbi:hypothetical protein X759_32380 [Mesorhizobium sp. LSHC420B00]|nr:hypothetical protein X759_32380 [Mesorhizobium sp. LSHC420B00]
MLARLSFAAYRPARGSPVLGTGVTAPVWSKGWWREAKEAGRNYLARQQGDAVLAAAGYNFSLLLRWRKALLGLLIAALKSQPKELEA